MYALCNPWELLKLLLSESSRDEALVEDVYRDNRDNFNI